LYVEAQRERMALAIMATGGTGGGNGEYKRTDGNANSFGLEEGQTVDNGSNVSFFGNDVDRGGSVTSRRGGVGADARSILPTVEESRDL